MRKVMRINPTFINWFKKEKISYKGIFFDIDGTILNGGKKIQGSDNLINYLNKINFPYIFLTNDGTHSHIEKSKLFKKAGLNISPKQLISCSDGLKLLPSNKINKEKDIFFIMGDLGKPNYADDAKLKYTRDIKKLNLCKGVIIGEQNYNWEITINSVLNFFIKNNNKVLIIPNGDSYWPKNPEEIQIGAGGIGRFIIRLLKENHIKTDFIYLGKPYKPIFSYAKDYLINKYKFKGKVNNTEFLMIGDFLKSDIYGANQNKFTSCLVLTGVTKKIHLNNIKKTSKYYPKFIFNKL